jgi:hypothetical protein
MREKKSMPKSMNNPMLRSMKKSKRKKDSPYFQIKDNHQKERVMIKGVQKYLELGKISKFHTLAQS